jgi:hypothetical protein
MESCKTILERGVESASPRIYQIADRLLSLDADAEWASRIAESFLRGVRLEPSLGQTYGTAHLTLRIGTNAPPPLPGSLQKFDVPGGVCYRNHQSYYFDVEGSRVAVGSKNDQQVEVWLGSSSQSRTTRSLITVMAYALPAALRRMGLYDLHAAGLVQPTSGSCFIFPGASMSGKTSLTIRLASAGWRYLSDDMLVISEGEKAVEARGLRRSFQASADVLDRFQLPGLHEALGVRIPNDPSKRRLDPERLFPGQFAPAAQPEFICFPEIAGVSESRLEKISHADAMMRLIAICPWSNYDTSAAHEHLRLLSQLVRQCETLVLYAGRDIYDKQTCASTLLSSVQGH